MSESHRTQTLRITEVALNWSGVIAIAGVVASFATVQADLRAGQQRQIELAEQLAQVRTAQAATAERLATKSDIDVVTRRLDNLYQLILQQEGGRRAVR